MSRVDLCLCSVLVRPSPQGPVAAQAIVVADDAIDVSRYHQWKNRVVKWLINFPQENPVDPCEMCIVHTFTEAEAHVPEVE